MANCRAPRDHRLGSLMPVSGLTFRHLRIRHREHLQTPASSRYPTSYLGRGRRDGHEAKTHPDTELPHLSQRHQISRIRRAKWIGEHAGEIIIQACSENISALDSGLSQWVAYRPTARQHRPERSHGDLKPHPAMRGRRDQAARLAENYRADDA